MAALDPLITAKHRLINGSQTVLLIGGMMLLLGLTGELIFGKGAFLWVALLTGLLLLFSPQLPPGMILRLYRASALSVRELREPYEIAEKLTRRAGLPVVPTLYYVPSSTANAFAVGNRRQPAIALTDGLLRRLSLRELAAVMAHEISHLRNRDLRVMALADTVSRLTRLMSVFGQILILINLPLLAMNQATISWIGLIMLLLAPTLVALLQLALSRTREFHADLGAVELTGDADGLASALVKISHHRSGWIERIFYPSGKQSDPSLLRSHPHVERRIQRLRELTPRPAEEIIIGEPISVDPELMPIITRRPRRHWSGVWY